MPEENLSSHLALIEKFSDGPSIFAAWCQEISGCSERPVITAATIGTPSLKRYEYRAGRSAYLVALVKEEEVLLAELYNATFVREWVIESQQVAVRLLETLIKNDFLTFPEKFEPIASILEISSGYGRKQRYIFCQTAKIINMRSIEHKTEPGTRVYSLRQSGSSSWWNFEMVDHGNGTQQLSSAPVYEREPRAWN